jgi:hypothetical protein
MRDGFSASGRDLAQPADVRQRGSFTKPRSEILRFLGIRRQKIQGLMGAAPLLVPGVRGRGANGPVFRSFAPVAAAEACPDRDDKDDNANLDQESDQKRMLRRPKRPIAFVGRHRPPVGVLSAAGSLPRGIAG